LFKVAVKLVGQSDEVMRRLLGTPGPVKSHEDAEDVDREDETTES
jgi:hypothetical protein